ncbi:MAG: hypothetical protein ACM3QS_14115 [Bacteroidota bacterium]
MVVNMDLIKRPWVIAALAGLVGLGLGLLFGWVVWPVQFVNATPAYLRADLQEDYLRMTIDSYRVNGDPNLAVRRWQDLGPNGPTLLEYVKAAPNGLDPQVVQSFSQLAAQYPPTGAAPSPAEEPAGSIWSRLILPVGGILVLMVLIIGSLVFLRGLLATRMGKEPSAGMQEAAINRQAERTNFEDLGLAPPITQTMTTYLLGDDLYDESFSIDTQGGEFLGEYGVGVSETIGVGDPKKVTALEIWLFDKNDIKTATKVLMSPHAFNDAGIRGRLEPKGELVLVEPQKQIILETETLQLLATVVDLQYGDGPLPPDSYFDRLTLELAVWPKGS